MRKYEELKSRVEKLEETVDALLSLLQKKFTTPGRFHHNYLENLKVKDVPKSHDR